MKRSTKAVIAGQFLLPMALLIGCSIRINCISLLYFVLLLAFPFIPVPTIGRVSWLTIKYAQCVMGTSLTASLSQLLFHIYLLSAQPYGRDFNTDCGLYEKIARQFGYQRWDLANSHQLFRLIFPEIIIFFTSVFTSRVYNRKSNAQQYTLYAGLFSAATFSFTTSYGEKPMLDPDTMPGWEKPHKSNYHLGKITAPARTLSEHLIRVWQRIRKSAWWMHCEKATCAIILCASGIAHPNLVSLLYFVVFLILANLWILNVTTRSIDRNRLMKALAAVSGAHLFLMYFYQFEFVQEFVNRRSIGARLAGLTAIYVTDCRDVRALVVNPDYRFSFLLHVIALGVLYVTCVKQICDDHRASFELIVKENAQQQPRGSTIHAEIRRSTFIRHSVSPENQKVKKNGWSEEPLASICNQEENGGEQNIAEREGQDVNYITELGQRENVVKPDEAIALSVERPRQSSEICATSIFKLKKKLAVKRDVAKRVIRAVRQYSYVGCLVVMMTWSVTYHSWMTFVLLLLACVIWMVPNPRQFCLRITPYLVCYAEVLLIFQYIYGLDLSEDELPSETIPLLHQIGFIKPHRFPACIHLLIKTTYTFVFWLTFKAYLSERQSNGIVNVDKLPDVEAGQMTAEHPTTLTTASGSEMPVTDEGASSPFAQYKNTESDEDASANQKERRNALLKLQGRSNGAAVSPLSKLARHQNLLGEMVNWFRRKVMQLWIIICCIVLLFISLRQPVVGYTIVYMALLLTFVNGFLISFRRLRKFLKYFWTLMIVYSMCILTLIYTYQFRKFPEMWHTGTGWSYDVLESLGLEQYSGGELLMKLMTPISFLICTVIQLKFFHKQLIQKTEKLEKALIETDARSKLKPGQSNIHKVVSAASVSELKEVDETDAQEDVTDERNAVTIAVQHARNTSGRTSATPTIGKKIEVDLAQLLRSGCQTLLSFMRTNRLRIIELTWRFLEMHMHKAVALHMMAISIHEVSAIHAPYPIFVAVLLPLENSRRVVYKLASVWTSIIILIKMVFQMKFVKPVEGYVNCSSVPGVEGSIYRRAFPFSENRTIDPSEWAGFRKHDNISAYLQPYFLLIGFLIVQEFVRMRQTLRRAVKKVQCPSPGVLFENITRRQADDGLLHCIMYFVNYFFYKFGFEVCCVTTVANIGLRCDFVSLLYGLWFVILLAQRRQRIARLWRFYVLFLAVLLPLQYLTCVGIPPSICSGYPWSSINHRMLEWLYLPDFSVPPNAVKLGADSVQFLFACCQMRVFEIERSPNTYYYPGGDNSELLKPLKVVSFKLGLKTAFDMCRVLEEGRMNARKSAYEDEVADFISYPKSYLDLLKIIVFQYLYWVTLTIIFVAGVSRVTLFAMGYVVAGFIFMWVGNELFLKPLSFGLRLWNTLILYNVIVILIKTSLQVIGCVFLDDLYKRYCWGLQLFGIACLKSRFDPAEAVDEKILADCKVPTTEAGIVFDGICFCFLLLQRRIITSRYFIHVVTEFKAQHVFANRGAELIHKIRSKQIWERQARERELVSKIKQKMEKIREAQVKMSVGGHSEYGLEGSSKQTEEQLDTFDCSDIPSLTHRTKKRRWRKFAMLPLDEEPADGDNAGTPSPPGDHAEVPEQRDWLSPTSAFNESMISSLHKSVTFDPSVLNREGSRSLPTLNLRSPDDVSDMDRPSSAASVSRSTDKLPSIVENIVAERTSDQNAPPAECQKDITESDGSKQHRLRFSLSADTVSDSSTSSVSSSRSEHSAAVPSGEGYRSIDFARTGRSISVVLDNAPALHAKSSLAEPISTHRYRASIDTDADAIEAIWDLELQDELDVTVPESEEDRRKGMGPLQLLNVAFKKGDIKAAVEDAKEMEAQEEELKKQMTADFGKADKKAIKEALKKRASTKIFADFEEETFDPDQVEAEVAAAMCRKRSSDVTVDTSEGNRASAEYDTDDAGTQVEETAHSSFASSPEPEQNLGALLAQTYLISRILAVWSTVVEFLNNTFTFLKLFLNGVLESAIAWLLKISREYRYVAHALTEEKTSFKSEKKLTGLVNRGPSLLKTSTYRKATRRRYGSGYEKRRRGRGLSFYDRKLAEEEARKFNKDRSAVVRLVSATYYVLLSRSELFCYLMMVLTHMASASLLTMPLPLMVFVWGTMSVPKPTRQFWIAAITYTEAIVIVKYLFQFGFFPWNNWEPPPSPFFAPRILGIERKDKYAAWELALLMMLFFHRSHMKTQGLWKGRRDTDADSVSSQPSAVAVGGSRRVSSVCSVAFRHKTLELMLPPSIPEESYSRHRVDSSDASQVSDPNLRTGDGGMSTSRIGRLRNQYRKWKARWRKVKLRRWLRSRCAEMAAFFKVLVNPRFRCSVDVYALMFLCDFVCFVIVIFGYWAFGTETASGGIASYFEENKIPRPFVAMLVVQFVLIIIDRALFLRKHLTGKVIYQIGLVLFVHIWMFFILPAVTDRRFVNSTPTRLWYFVKCIYFCLSAWQIRSGYPTRVLGNMLTKKYNYLNMMLFKGFMTIPFLFELRALMDWIWTDTSMSLSDWLKLEDIYANIYLIKCERQVEEDYPTPRGVKRRSFLKYGCGGALLFLMILIIWFPLVLFSLANTVGWRSLPVEITLKLTLGTSPPLFQARVLKQSDAYSPLVTTMTDSEYTALQYEHRHSKIATAYMSDYSATDVVRVTFHSYSDTVWGISPAARLNLIRDLNSDQEVALKFEWSFARAPDSFGQAIIVSDENVISLEPGNQIRTKLQRQLAASSSALPVDLPYLYPSYVKIPGKGKAAPVHALLARKDKDDIQRAFENTTLNLIRTEREEYWKISTITRGPYGVESLEQLQMIGFVDKVFPATFNMVAGGGIIGFYLGLVFVVGKFIRSLVTGGMSRIMFEDLPNVDRILQLCLDIFLVREAGELALEEDLFAKLIFIYRSPATLIKWTKLKKS